MQAAIKVTWLRKVMPHRVDEWRYSSPENWIKVDLTSLSANELATVAGLAQTQPEKQAAALLRKIKLYRKLVVAYDTLLVNSLESACLAFRCLLEKTPHKWLFQSAEDGHTNPWYVYCIEHVPYCTRTEHPAHVAVSMAAMCRGHRITQEVCFYKSEMYKTATEMLEARNFYVETPLLVTDYQTDNTGYQEAVARMGEQFICGGWGKELSGWASGELVSMSREDRPSRVVMDDTAHTSSADRNVDEITDAFWRSSALKTEDDAEDVTSTDEEAPCNPLPVHLYAAVFDLALHEYLTVHTANLKPYVYDETLADKLILPPARKDLISLLVAGADSLKEDIIVGKSGGIIVICTGPPGTGKTLSAEVFSEYVKRPLYCVQCSQLGTSARTLEEQLQKVLDRAARWKAILLIDEADVYVHARGNDIEQNAIVGVFLRLLEYYRGVLFLTSNRETIIDDAIMSRATAWIRYELPSLPDLQLIWQVLSKQYDVSLAPEDVAQLAAYPPFQHISGRSVKNLLKLARLLSIRKQAQVTVEMLKQVAQYLPLEIKNGA